ncbi:MAG: DUF5110 domain-containing protein [Muribaculaceae bacterium]|nr:DUF5110 domain-containing protein [Muribaculaceae bacterium]
MRPLSVVTFFLAASAAMGQQLRVTTAADVTVTVTALTDNIVKVSHVPVGTPEYQSPLVVLHQPDATTTTWRTGDRFQFMTTDGGMALTLDNRSGSVSIMAAPDRFVIDNGVRAVHDGKTELSLVTAGECAFYGGGERAHAFDLAGDTLAMYNRPNYGYSAGDPRNDVMNITMPIAISSDGYAVVFDDYAASEMILGNPIKYISEARTPVTYYFVDGGGTVEGTVRELTRLTGRQALPPLWTLGYITSRYGYRTQDETLGVVDTLRRNGYPIDGLVLDLYWYGREEDMGRLDWEPDQWPDPKSMLSELKKQNVNVVAISQPYVLSNGRGAANFDKLSDRSLLLTDSAGATQPVEIWVGTGGMFDVSNPATRAWIADRYKRVLLDNGITGLWGDLGEPEKHPESGLHANGLPTRLYHNLYGNDWSRLASDVLREARPDERPMVMMRGGTIGLQRYDVFPWSGDVARSWEGMQAQPLIMLQSGLSGLGYMSHDIGGFAVDPEHPSDPEMYQRWLQLGLFSPVLRTHAQSMAEPYNYTEIQPALLDLIRERYAWLPYNYTLAYENASQGLPLVRPVNFYRSDDRLNDISDQYLWGRDILVAPVMKPGATERSVIVPDGVWFNLNNPATAYTLGDTAHLEAPLDVIPLMVRAGAFIPKADKVMSSTADYDASHLAVGYYPAPGVTSSYSLYDDDHSDPDALAKGAFTLLNFDGKAESGQISIDVARSGAYPGMPAGVKIDFTIHRVDAGRKTSVTVNGKKVKFKAKGDTITFTADVTDSTAILITGCSVKPI